MKPDALDDRLPGPPPRRPWLLAIAGTLLTLWLAFLAWLAYGS